MVMPRAALPAPLVDLVVVLRFAAELLRQDGGDRSGQRGLAMVNVADGADVDVRLGPLELTLSHIAILKIRTRKTGAATTLVGRRPGQAENGWCP
jgi:hypothetical protein